MALIGDFSFPTSKILTSEVTSGQTALSSSSGTYTDLGPSLSLSAGTWILFYSASIENQNMSGSGAAVQGIMHYLVIRDSSNNVINSSQLMYCNLEQVYDFQGSTFSKILTVASTTTYKLSHRWQINSGSPSTSTPYARPDNNPSTLIAIKLY